MSNLLPKDLLCTQELIYKPNNYSFSKPKIQVESAEYGASVFNVNGLNVLFRVAKITPTKTGQFVTLWKRIGREPIQPYDKSDSIDLFVICTRYKNHFGQFVFPKSTLIKHDIMSGDGTSGKRAIRVYPPWDQPTSRQAKNTQIWQQEYFLEIPSNSSIDFTKAKKLHTMS